MSYACFDKFHNYPFKLISNVKDMMTTPVFYESKTSTSVN